MKIKRYTAVSMRAALAQVRAEQGPDAVILSSQLPYFRRRASRPHLPDRI